MTPWLLVFVLLHSDGTVSPPTEMRFETYAKCESQAHTMMSLVNHRPVRGSDNGESQADAASYSCTDTTADEKPKKRKKELQ